MKFKVTATIPIELEIDCQSKKEALDTATTILQEQRYDDDYASIVADCIESALVSGSVNMTATDNHEALVNELRTKRKISIKDMPDSFVLNKSRIFQVNDPCCGAGCLLLAGYNAMREQLEPTDPDWDKYVLFVAQDIDPLVCKMCYIQMCCIGVPGVVVAGNSLFPDAEREPTDFWFTHKYFALDEKALENTYQQKKE